MAEPADAALRYWTWDEIQRFLIDNDLAIAAGLNDDDEMGLTGKGRELFDVLSVAIHLGGSPAAGSN